MLTGDNVRTRNVRGFNTSDVERHLSVKINDWCNKNADREFAARDLVGGKFTDWTQTPELNALYQFRLRKYNGDGQKAYKQAGKDAGAILKQVLKDDSRLFRTRYCKKARHYLLVE